MNFDIKTEQLSGDSYVISLAGEVDLYTAPEFKQQLLEVIARGGKQVVVDFTSTTFIDSTTLGVLVGGVKRLRPAEGRLSLVCNNANIVKIFEITGLDRVFEIYDTRARSFGGVEVRLCRALAAEAGKVVTQARMAERLEEAYFATLGALAAALEAKDAYTNDHAIEIAELSMALTDGLRAAHAEGRSRMTSGEGLRLVIKVLMATSTLIDPA